MIRNNNKTPKTLQGDAAEKQALTFLQDKGLKILHQNYSCKFGEVDLIMQEGEAIVFVEVRYRKSLAFGGAAASVDTKKQQRILNTAKHYLVKHNIFEKKPVRFDVLAVVANDMQWIKGAF